MAKLAAAGPFPHANNVQFGGGGSKVTTTTLKRKTPSELRGELLKRKNVNVMELVDKSPFPAAASTKDGDGVVLGNKKDLLKNPRYIDTRMDELFPSRKNNISLRLLSKKEIAKENPSVEDIGRLKNSSVATHLAAESQPQDLCKEDSATSVPYSEDGTSKTCKAAEKCNDSSFRSVAELSLGGENLPGLSNLDMDKALKGLVARGPLAASDAQAEFAERTNNYMTQSSSLDFIVSGKKTPLDLTLKTTMRVISSTSVNWFHRLVNRGTFYNQSRCGSYAVMSRGQVMNHFSGRTDIPGCTSGALRSWVFPQSPLPPAVISALTSAAVGGQADFFSNRQQAWEDSFRSLYYMLRKGICDLFYVCSSQFVVMFSAYDGPKKPKHTCNAFISQSTRGLRSLLKQHDVCFSMPLFHSKGDDITAEDLVELSEIEKPSLDQVDQFVSIPDVDNGPQSLLMFTGNQNVHGLYDFLLNFRFFFTSLTGVDVPVLYSPVPFENAALSSPQVRCKEVRRADQLYLPLKDSNGDVEPTRGSSPGICYSVEIKDAYLPPWVVSCICSAMGSDGTSFEASFMTEHTSIGLNVALDINCQASETQAGTASGKALQESSCNFGVQQTIFSPHLRSAFLKGLKYKSGSYTASVAGV